jgi:hypothetical protein
MKIKLALVTLNICVSNPRWFEFWAIEVFCRNFFSFEKKVFANEQNRLLNFKSLFSQKNELLTLKFLRRNFSTNFNVM